MLHRTQVKSKFLIQKIFFDWILMKKDYEIGVSHKS